MTRSDELIHACFMNNIADVQRHVHAPMDSKYIYEAMRIACMSGHVGIVRVLLPKFTASYNINDMLKEACHYNRLEILKLLMDAGATELAAHLEAVCFRGNADILDYIFQRYPTIHINVRLFALIVGVHGRIDVMTVFLKHNKIPIPMAFEYACTYGHAALVQFLMDYTKMPLNLNRGMAWAGLNGHAEVMKLLIDRGAQVLCNIAPAQIGELVNLGLPLKWFKQQHYKISWAAQDEIANLERIQARRRAVLAKTLALPTVLISEIVDYMPFDKIDAPTAKT
jgi:ankyrin repeat protein